MGTKRRQRADWRRRARAAEAERERRDEGRRGGGTVLRALQRRTRPSVRRVTPEELASGAWEGRMPRPRHAMNTPEPVPHLDLVDYLITRGYCRTRAEALGHLLGGRVNVNGKVWAYPHVPKHSLSHDEFGRPRIMVEGVPDPRPVR